MFLSVDLDNTDYVNIDNNSIEVLQLNGIEIWGGFKKLNQLIDRSIESVNAEDLEGVTSIGNQAFNYCTSLISAIIPSSVTSIGQSAFYNCTSLTTIRLLSTNPPTLGLLAIPTEITRIEVPSESLSEYQNATNWSSLADKMVGV